MNSYVRPVLLRVFGFHGPKHANFSREFLYCTEGNSSVFLKIISKLLHIALIKLTGS